MNVAGYAYLWDSRADDPAEWPYCVQPHAFSARVAEAAVPLTWDHNRRLVLAHTLRGGSLEIWCDDHGLAFQASVDAATLGAVVREQPGCSVTFRPIHATHQHDGYVDVASAAVLELCFSHAPMFPQTGVWAINAEPEAMPRRLHELRADHEARRMDLRAQHAPAQRQVRNLLADQARRSRALARWMGL